MDASIVLALKGYRSQLEFCNGGGYHVLSRYLRRDFGIIVNPKKVYRICEENKLLLPRKKKRRRDDKKISENRLITGPNQLWQFDIKYGYIHGENKFFYLLAFIDVFTKEILAHYTGLSCKGPDLIATFEEAYSNRKGDKSKLVIRSDNGPQMSSNRFREWVRDKVDHEFIPPGCPNKDAYIESFFSIFEIEFLQVRYFRSFAEAYEQTAKYIRHYNFRRLHGSIRYLPPGEFREKFELGMFGGMEISA